MVHVPSARCLDHGYITVSHDITVDIDVGDDRGPYLVATCLHHQLFEPSVRVLPRVMDPQPGRGIALSQPMHTPVVVHTEQDPSTPTIGERDHVLREFVAVSHIAPEFDAGILAVCNDFPQFSLGYRSAPEPMLLGNSLWPLSTRNFNKRWPTCRRSDEYRWAATTVSARRWLHFEKRVVEIDGCQRLRSWMTAASRPSFPKNCRRCQTLGLAAST